MPKSASYAIKRKADASKRRADSGVEEMTLGEVASVLDATVLSGSELLDKEVRSACGSDMMSDVLAYVKDQAILLTGLVNPQVIRTALMMDMKCVCFVRGKRPDAAMLKIASDNGVVVMTTTDRMFVACGKLYSRGLTGE